CFLSTYNTNLQIEVFLCYNMIEVKSMRELSNIQEKILDKALYLIGKEGSYNIPIRAIAKEANVNVNAINYYFHSKEEMMNCIKEFYIDNTKSAYSPIYNDEYNDEDKILYAANEIMEYTLQYPGVLIILKEAMKNKDIDPLDKEIIKLTEKNNNRFHELLDKVFYDKENSKSNFMILFSSILYPAM